jgi:hypothetical protein
MIDFQSSYIRACVLECGDTSPLSEPGHVRAFQKSSVLVTWWLNLPSWHPKSPPLPKPADGAKKVEIAKRTQFYSQVAEAQYEAKEKISII